MEPVAVGDGYAEAADFDAATQGTVTLVNTASAVFEVRIAEDGTPEPRETFRVRLSDLQGPDNLSVSAAGSALVNVVASNGTDYDPDDDNLINVAMPSQLSAIRYDLGGRGLRGVHGGAVAPYAAAFRFFDEVETCPDGCIGYELSNDVDLAGVSHWTPIGGGTDSNQRRMGTDENERYEAVFEGNGHVVRNMAMYRSVHDHYHHVGLFGILGVSGTIRSVGMVNVNVKFAQRRQLYRRIGGE